MLILPVKQLLRRGTGWLFALVVALAIAGPAAAADDTLEIVTRDGVHVFQIELAVTDQQRTQGLMYRRELPDGRGMLFDFKTDTPVTMWMKNTYISLDMIFIRSDGRIHHIAQNTTPESERVISSNGPVRFVLEVIAGTARKYGIAPGDRVAHSWIAKR